MDHDSGSGEPRLPISKAILAVLDRHGIPERQRLTTLETAVEMSYQQVRRRMTGESPWSVDEVKRLAAHFGEPLFGLLATLVDDVGHPATLHLGGLALPCSLWLGPPAPPGARVGPLVAVQGEAADAWIAVPLAEAGDRPAYEIKRLIFEAAPPRRVAVVVDDDSLAAGIVQFLREKGLDAIAYQSRANFLAVLETSRFDGFILDWVLGEGHTSDLLPPLRAKHPTAPTILLTDRPQAGEANDEALAATLGTYRAQLYEKPTSMLSLFTALQLGFEPTPRAG